MPCLGNNEKKFGWEWRVGTSLWTLCSNRRPLPLPTSFFATPIIPPTMTKIPSESSLRISSSPLTNDVVIKPHKSFPFLEECVFLLVINTLNHESQPHTFFFFNWLSIIILYYTKIYKTIITDYYTNIYTIRYIYKTYIIIFFNFLIYEVHT